MESKSVNLQRSATRQHDPSVGTRNGDGPDKDGPLKNPQKHPGGPQEPAETEGGTEVAVKEGRPKVKEPPHFAVVLLNDDYTTMEFVVAVLKRFFRRTEEEAVQIMLRVHHEGKGVAGIYSFEIAETKVSQVHDYAQSHGFPLRCAVEPAP